MSLHPVQLHLLEQQRVLEVTWSDGHLSAFSLKYLRGWCPCAHCQGHFSATKTFIGDANFQLVGADPVGNYAVNLKWADGHKHGIYSWAYLLDLEKGPPSAGPTNQQCIAETGAA